MQVFKFPLNIDFPGQLTKQLSRLRKNLVLRGLKIECATNIFSLFTAQHGQDDATHPVLICESCIPEY